MGGRQNRQGSEPGIPFERASAASPEAASGLRPVAVFVGIAAVLLAVGARSVYIQSFAEGAQPDVLRVTESPSASFSILDREGRPLATSVESFDVTISPQALWRSHTPDRICRGIAEILDSARNEAGSPWRPLDVLARAMPRSMFPPAELANGLDPEPIGAGRGLGLAGRLTPVDPELLVFGQADLGPVRAWLDSGKVAPGDLLPAAVEARPSLLAHFAERPANPPIRGLALVPLPPESPSVPGARRWTLAMDPVECLGARSRREQLGEVTRKDGTVAAPPPERWTRRLLDDLQALIGSERLLGRLEAERSAEVRALQPMDRRMALRDALWAEFIPTRFRVLAQGIDPVSAHALRELCEAEAVSRYQLQLIPRMERRHPTRPGAQPVAPDPRAGLSGDEDAFALLGHWGVLDPDRALARATRDRDVRPHVIPWDEAPDPFEAYRRSLVVDDRPWSGIELLCRTELENGPWAKLSGRAEAIQGRRYGRRVRYVARDRRRAWSNGVPNYFESAGEGADAPRIEVTLDAHLQETLHRELGDMMASHGPAIAMGIAVDVETGDVLALDTRTRYPYSGFAPVRHVFTPGSTFKAIIMALALDSGATTQDSIYPTFAGSTFRVEGRPIGEAEGAPTKAEITAAEGLAYSCNAVLVQIALGMEASFLRRRLVELGYAQRPGAGLGPERAGTLPPLDRNGSWSRAYAHASVGFGHEVGVTLWQHAEALATVLRGGVSRPLRLLRSIERDGEYWEREVESGVRVISEGACRTVAQMMAVGANIGTGRHIAADAMHPEFDWIGTKTGTTEKVPTELCVHVELEALSRAAENEARWTKELRRKLFEVEKPHRSGTCYTSSICAAGRATVDGETREIMVLIVADDAVGRERFGSRVTGPTAMAVLRQAFGFPRVSPLDDSVAGRAARLESGDRLAAPREAGHESVVIEAFQADWLDQDLPWAEDFAREFEATFEEPLAPHSAGSVDLTEEEQR